MKITETYTGTDATLEILIMLLGAFILGAILMWLYNELFTECIEEDEDEEEQEEINYIPAPVVEKIKPVNLEDDLKIVEGIGPKIESLLKEEGIKTFEKLSESTPEHIAAVLRERGGERYAFHNPTTWPDQAKLAHEGRMTELEEYQDFLQGGKM